MKKRFALYGMFAAMAIFAAACGDDSSSSASAPEDEEYSSSIDDEESSSSEEAVSSSSAKKDGKSSSSEAKKDDKSSSSEKATSSSSSEAKKDDKSSSSEKATSSSSAKDDSKSSSSEAKKDDKSSSSEKPESSSSEPESSSSEISYETSCTAKTEGRVVTVDAHIYTDDKGEDKRIVSVDYENLLLSQISSFATFGLTSCEAAKNQFGESLESCSAEDKTIVLVQKFPSIDIVEEVFGPFEDAEKTACSSLMSEFTVDTSALNQDMLKAGKYGTFRDTRDAMLYRTIKVGGQTWMAQNLMYETKSGTSCYDDPVPEGVINGNCQRFGRLYTWETAQDACPDGWRLPTTTEWDNLLTKTMGADSAIVDMGMTMVQYNTAGVSLLGGDSHANTYGLSFVLGGAYGYPGAETLEYTAFGISSIYWLDDGNGKVSMAFVSYYGEDEQVRMVPDLEDSQMQFSVRCVKK